MSSAMLSAFMIILTLVVLPFALHAAVLVLAIVVWAVLEISMLPIKLVKALFARRTSTCNTKKKTAVRWMKVYRDGTFGGNYTSEAEARSVDFRNADDCLAVVPVTIEWEEQYPLQTNVDSTPTP